MKSANPIQVALVSAGSSESSSTTALVRQIGAAVREMLENEGALVEVHLVNLREVGRDLGIGLATGMISDDLRADLQIVEEADAVVAGTPVYKAGMSGLFKSFWDLVADDAILATPVVLAATAGTPRHGLVPDAEMRSLFAYLRALTVPTSVFVATEDSAYPSAVKKRVERAATELATLAALNVKHALRNQEKSEYRRTFPDHQVTTESVDAGIDFDSDLMRLAAGGA